MVLDNANLVQWTPKTNVNVHSPIEFYGQLSSLFSSEGWEIVEDLSHESVHWIIKLNDDGFESFQHKIFSVTKGKGEIRFEKGAKLPTIGGLRRVM